MTRRGLQITFVVGIMALGAALSFGQMQVQSVEIVNFHPNVNGVYNFNVFNYDTYENDQPINVSVFIGPGEAYVYQNGTMIVRIEAADSSYSWITFLPDGTVSYDPSVYPDAGNWSVYVDGVLWSSGVGIEPDPYDEAFPDWESASVKIPLGFGLGMAFWAAAVALTMPMKWIKELGSAAS